MKSIGTSAEEKKLREAQTRANAAADWAYVIQCTARGGGAGRMVKRGK